eukprot:1176014-Prorocentrum_minimum.AAC.1
MHWGLWGLSVSRVFQCKVAEKNRAARIRRQNLKIPNSYSSLSTELPPSRQSTVEEKVDHWSTGTSHSRLLVAGSNSTLDHWSMPYSQYDLLIQRSKSTVDSTRSTVRPDPQTVETAGIHSQNLSSVLTTAADVHVDLQPWPRVEVECYLGYVS